MFYKQTFKLLTFYKFVTIENPLEEVRAHLVFCNDIGLKGRIYIWEEGISATMTCNMGQYHAYRMFIANNPYFNDIDHIEDKWTDVDGHQFDKMIVKYRKEIVALDENVTWEEVKDCLQTISVDEFKRVVDEKDPDYAILDMRNTYEFKLGHFKGAEPAGTINFRDVDELFESYKKKYKDKKVVMYCTGWIRCEKLNVMLKKRWIDNFYGLEGWVVTYTNKFGDGNWLGSLYTFDGVISTRVNPDDKHTTIGECIYSGHHTDHTENCRYSPCNARIIARRRDYKKHAGFCSEECFTKAKNDILVKTEKSVDKLDYKQLRGDVKAGKKTKTDAIKLVTEHLDVLIGDIKFKYSTSQKEDVVDKAMIESCFVK